VNEEYDEIPSSVSLSHRGVDVFAFTMASLHKSKLWMAVKDFNDLVLLNSMLSKELVENFFEPDEADDSQSRTLV